MKEFTQALNWIPLAAALSFVSALGFAAGPAAAIEPLTKGNQFFLCEQSANAVSAESFHAEVLRSAGIPQVFLAHAVEQGLTYGQMIDLAVSGSTEFPDARAIEDASPAQREKVEAQARAMQRRLISRVGGISGMFTNKLGGDERLEKPVEGYYLANAEGLDDRYRLSAAFGLRSGAGRAYVIKCAAEGEGESPQPEGGGDVTRTINSFVKDDLGNFRLRSDRDELFNAYRSGDYASEEQRLRSYITARSASFSYRRNKEENTRHFNAEGIAGFKFAHVTPFVAFKYADQNGDRNDIEVVSPGLQFSFERDGVPPEAHWYRPDNWAFDLRSDVLAIIDSGNGAKRLAVELSAAPRFTVDDRQVLGVFNKVPGIPVYFRPTARPLVEASHILDAGTNRAFAEAENFVGAGAAVGVKFTAPEWPLLDSAVLSFDYRKLKVVAGGSNAYSLFEAALTWTPKDVPYMDVTFSYTRGEEDYTLQQQDKYAVKLGVKF